MRLEMASSLKELSVGGGGQTRLSIISTFRSPLAITGGGSESETKISIQFSDDLCPFLLSNSLGSYFLCFLGTLFLLSFLSHS